MSSPEPSDEMRTESIKRFEEKQAKAQEQRERLLEEKAQRYKEKAKKTVEIKAWQEEQQIQKIAEMNQKLLKAEELRNQQLTKIKRKAHDEESKVSEILFINTLEAQNKRHDILSKTKDSEARLQDIQEERQRKQEEKAAKEAAAEDRRKAIETERQARLDEIKEKRKQKDKKLEQQMQEKEKERLEQASQKQRNREQKLSAISAAQQANVEELAKKIFMKQEASQKRYLENMDCIRQKAVESSIRRCTENDDAPRSAPYGPENLKMCSLCKVIIGSEVYLYSHLRGKKHQDAIKELHQGQTPSCDELESYNLKQIVDAPAGSKANDFSPELANLERERLKSINKRCKRLKQRILAKGDAYEAEWRDKSRQSKIPSPNKSKTIKLVKELNSLNSDSRVTGPWLSNMLHSLEKVLSGLHRVVTLSDTEKQVFNSLGGIDLLSGLLNRITSSSKDRPASFSDKTFVHICSLYECACSASLENCRYVFNSNNVTILLDCLAQRLSLLVSELSTVNSNFQNRIFDSVAGAIAKLLAVVFETLCRDRRDISSSEHDQQWIQDVISYTISVGIVDKLSLCIVNAQGPLDGEPELAHFLQSSLAFLTTLTRLFATSRSSPSLTLASGAVQDGRFEEDATQLIITLRMTQICGVVPLVYGMLLHTGVFSKSGQSHSPAPSPAQSAKHTLEVAQLCLKLLNQVACIDLTMLQAILGSEGLSLQLRHISSYLLLYCSHWKEDTRNLLHEVVLLIGNFTVLNPDNQVVVQLGQKPTILQQLCMMPFEYFSDPLLKAVLFPTLICCCYKSQDNKATLEEEMSALMLISFIETTTLEVQLKAVTKQKTDADLEEKWCLSARFPKNHWTQAKLFFDANGFEG